MLRQVASGYALKQGAKLLPGGWVTVLLLSPQGRAVGKAVARHGWRQVRERRGR